MFNYVQIREYHRRHPSARVAVDASEDYENLLKEEPLVEFSGEVNSGLCCELNVVERLILVLCCVRKFVRQQNFLCHGFRGGLFG